MSKTSPWPRLLGAEQGSLRVVKGDELGSAFQHWVTQQNKVSPLRRKESGGVEWSEG